MNCIIVDDQTASRKTLRNFLEMLCPQVTILAEANSLAGAKKVLIDHNPDLVFLDIEMEGRTTFDLLSELEIIDFLVIFVTGYDTYSLDAIKNNAIDYLLKPVNPNELNKAVEKAEKQLEMIQLSQVNKNEKTEVKKQLRIALPSAQGTIFTEIQNIACCKADNTYTIFSFVDNPKKLIVSKPIKYYEKILVTHGFFRAHKSYLVNLEHVVKFSQTEGFILEMKNKENIPMARTRKDDFFERMNIL